MVQGESSCSFSAFKTKDSEILEATIHRVWSKAYSANSFILFEAFLIKLKSVRL